MPGSRDDDRGGNRNQRGSRDRSERARDDVPRGPRPPIKGRRRTFDEDSAPNPRERARLDRSADAEGTEGAPRRGERWVDEGPVRRAAGEAAARGARRPPKGRGPGRSGRSKDTGRDSGRTDTSSDNTHRRRQRATKRAEQALEIDRDRLVRQLGAAKADRSIGRLGEAADAFAQDRYEEARKLLKPLADAIPAEPAIRELYGLTLYRMGRWRPAIAELEAFAQRTSSVEQHPVLADCYRALGRHERVQELWDELGEASPEASVVAEGRIVLAGSFADQGQLPKAIAVLEQGALGSKKLKYHHLRLRYVLADLYDRAGEHQAARRQFEAVAANDPDFFDVQDRLRQL